MALATDAETLIAVALGFVHVAFGLCLLCFPPGLWFWLEYVAAMVAGLAVVQVQGRRYAA